MPMPYRVAVTGLVPEAVSLAHRSAEIHHKSRAVNMAQTPHVGAVELRIHPNAVQVM